MREEGECKGTEKENVVGGVDGEGLMTERLERVGTGHRRGGEECREMKRAKNKGWTNGKRVERFLKI